MHQRSKPLAMASLLATSVFYALGPSNALAADYTVQIGAFGAAPEKTFTRDASEFGEVMVNEAGDGVTRVSVGRYATKSEAVDAQTRLRIAGYNDAYVTSVKSGLTATSGSPNAAPAQTAAARPATSSAPGKAPTVAAPVAAATSSSQAGRFRLRTHDTQSGETTDLQVSPAGGNQPPAVVAGVGADKVPPHLRNKLVYLDGVPHIKEGDQFIPMKDVVAGKP